MDAHAGPWYLSSGLSEISTFSRRKKMNRVRGGKWACIVREHSPGVHSKDQPSCSPDSAGGFRKANDTTVPENFAG